jgi:hypothetical protein
LHADCRLIALYDIPHQACEPSIQMRQLHWGKLPDAKIKGTIWEKDVTDEHVKVRSPLRASDALLSASDDL